MRKWSSLLQRRRIFTTTLGDEFHQREGAKIAMHRKAKLNDMIREMEEQPGGNEHTYGKLLWACSESRALQEGIYVHRHIAKHGLDRDMFLATCLVTMYGKCRRVMEARQVFDGMPKRSVYSWTAMIAAYAQNGHRREAFALFEQIDVVPNCVTLLTCITACTDPSFLEVGMKLHRIIRQNKFDSEMNVANSVLNMYSKCGTLKDAERHFWAMPFRNVITWNIMVSAYVEHGQGKLALIMFQMLLNHGEPVSFISFINILNAFDSFSSLESARWVHTYIAEAGHFSNPTVGSALVSMYARCGSFHDAKKTFDEIEEHNVVTWTTMLTACCQYEECSLALKLYHKMQLDGILPNEVTLASVINACVTLHALEQGRRIHDVMVESALFRPGRVLENALIDLYGKCGDLSRAVRMFETMDVKDVLTWTVLLTAYAYNGHHRHAIYLYDCMVQEGFKMDKTCYVGVIGSCTSISNLTKGRNVHLHAIESGYSTHTIVSNAIMDMYSKCGCPGKAISLFHEMPAHDVVAWNALVASFSQHGHGEEVPKLFSRMQQDGVKPDRVTFITLLTACSHAGLVEQGCDYFVSIENEYKMVQSSECYGCVVDLLARAGHLAEAESFIVNRFPDDADRRVPWMAILSGCSVYADPDRGRRASKYLSDITPKDSSPHVVLSNIFTHKTDESASKDARNFGDHVFGTLQASFGDQVSQGR